MDEQIEPTDGLMIRTFEADITAGDGRTADVRIVPYGETITHTDGHGGVPKGTPYTETYVPGAFNHQLKAANRVFANFEHQQGLAGVIGHGVAFKEGTDGFYGSFRIHESPEGDKALMMIREGILHGISVEAKPVKSVRTVSGLVQRVKANLVNVAFCREGAYAGAEVLALREPATMIDETLLPKPIDPELLERCRKLGMVIPERMAHPTTGTPAEGTPEGTRQQTDANSLLEDQRNGNTG